MARRSLTIRVGELFAEVCDRAAPPETQPVPWFLPKKPLAEALKEKVDLKKFNHLNLQLLYRPDALPTDRFLENKIAVLVTSGFEGAFAEALEQKNLPVMSDLIFGVSERIDSTGKILKKVDLSELELIGQKLKLMKVEQVLVASLNSFRNNENQTAVANYFEGQGFKVFQDSSLELDESRRWPKLIEQAQWQHLIEDLEEQLSEIKKSADLSFERLSQVSFESPTFYAGLDIFWLSQNCTVLESQPNDVVEPGFFDSPEFKHLLQRNGPLLLGKSLRPTALDLFLLDDPSFQVDGIVAAQFDRMRSRIEEALAVMSKGQQQGSTRIDGSKVVTDTLNIFVTALASELRTLATKESLKVEGPLAQLVLKHLKQIDSNLKLEWGVAK